MSDQGYQRDVLRGAVFVNLSSAYDAVNHTILIEKLYSTTRDITLCNVPEHTVQPKMLYGAEQRAKQMEKLEE